MNFAGKKLVRKLQNFKFGYKMPGGHRGFSFTPRVGL